MANISLNIYEKGSNSKIEKTLEADGYDLMLGTVEDFMEIIDLDKINDRNEVAKMAVIGYKKLKPLVMDIFPELQEDEYKRIKVNELVRLIVQIATSIIDNLDILKDQKN